MEEPEERGAGWRMNTGFAGDADATASAASGADRSMTEPEEHSAGRPMLTAFASDTADANSLHHIWSGQVNDRTGGASWLANAHRLCWRRGCHSLRHIWSG